MRATQFLKEYEDLGQEKANIIKTISGLDAADENQAALLDRIWKLLNSDTFGNNITNAFVTTTKDEYMQAATLEGHRKNVAEIISRLDSDYGALNGFLKKLESGGAVNLSELAKPVNTFNAVFGGDAVAMKAFDALKGYGVGEKQKGPGEFALAMMSNKIRLAQGEGDTEIDGIGKVEVKAAMGSKGSGGRLGHGGAQQDAQAKILMKYKDVIPNTIQRWQANSAGTMSLGVFVDNMDAELPVGGQNAMGQNNKVRFDIGNELWSPIFGNFGSNIARTFSTKSGREETINSYLKNNFDWYKTKDNFDAYLLISFTFGKTGMGRTGDDLIKMRQSGQLVGDPRISVIPSKAGAREFFAQISLNNSGV